ncbi:hypothetical protein [Ottowia beijingensis]|uniref:hypothetical protein n=1 Tax=Ottowia beijingensis TaxID=1207057 RepID=UPI002FDA4265
MKIKSFFIVRRAAAYLNYLAAQDQVVTGAEFAQMLGLVTPNSRTDGIRRAIEILEILDRDDLRKSRPRRSAMVVQERGSMMGLPYPFFWKDDITTIEERKTRHQKIIRYVVQYPYALKCSEGQRRHIESVLGIDIGTGPRRYWPEPTSRTRSEAQSPEGTHWHKGALSDSQNGLLRDITHLINTTSRLGQSGISRARAAEGIMFALPEEYSIEEFGEDIDALVRIGCLREFDGILNLPIIDPHQARRLSGPARQHGGHEVVERHV